MGEWVNNERETISFMECQMVFSKVVFGFKYSNAASIQIMQANSFVFFPFLTNFSFWY